MENKITKIGHQSVYSIASDMINMGCYTISDIMEFGFNEEQATLILEQMKEM